MQMTSPQSPSTPAPLATKFRGWSARNPAKAAAWHLAQARAHKIRKIRKIIAKLKVAMDELDRLLPDDETHEN